MILLLLAQFAFQAPSAAQDSPAAARARAELETVRSGIDMLKKLQERDQRLQEKLRAGVEDPEELKKIVKQREELIAEFNQVKEAAIKGIDALIASAAEGLKAAPEDPGLLEVRAEALHLSGRGEEGLPDLEALAKLRPEDAAVALKLARLHHAANRYERAAANLERVLRKDPRSVEARLLLALCDFAIHKFEESGRIFAEMTKEEGIDPRQKSKAAQFQKMSEDYGPLWKAEQEIRAREAKADDLPRVTLATSRGEIEIELLENEAPNTVANFIELVGAKFYDGKKFHRVIPSFMAQGGCPTGDGTGDAGYRFKDETQGGYRRHFRGSLSMANSGPDTNGSQFFITHLPTEWLNGRHTVFGRVLKGQEIVDALQKDDVIVKAEVLRKRDHPYKVKKLGD